MGRAPDENEQTGDAQFLALTVDAFHRDRLEASLTVAIHYRSPQVRTSMLESAPIWRMR